MAAPQKPWEAVGHNNREALPCFQSGDGSVDASTFQSMERNTMSVGGAVRRPPALPVRDGAAQTGSYGSSFNRFNGSSYGGYGGYNNSMNSYYSSPLSSGYGNSMYSSYGYGSNGYGNRFGGGYGNGYNGYGGAGQEGYSRFLQQAEENSRPAFQSIESIVQAFASVSMMLESTFQTVHNCFRAVIGVADHFSRLKINMAKIFSALAFFRFLRYMYRRLLELLRLREAGFAEEVWKDAEQNALEVVGGLSQHPDRKSAPSWPIFLFFAVVVGGPYVIWKLLCSRDETEGIPEWATGEEDHVVARAEYDFDSESHDEISFKAGHLLNLAPKELQPKVRGWLLASTGGSKIGLVPANYIKVQGKRRGRKYTIPETDRQISSSSVTNLPTIIEEGTSNGSQETSASQDVNTSSQWHEWTGPDDNFQPDLNEFNKGDNDGKRLSDGPEKGVV